MMTHTASQSFLRIYIPRGNFFCILVSNRLHILLRDVRVSYGFDRFHVWQEDDNQLQIKHSCHSHLTVDIVIFMAIYQATKQLTSCPL